MQRDVVPAPPPARALAIGRWLAPVAVLLLGLGYYTRHLLDWLAYDDEGGYLYAAWRISLGEVPYRDFLTPQLPAFLYPGALLLTLTDSSVLAARLSMAVYTLAACGLLFLTVRRLWGGRPALLALMLAVAQAETFWAGRFFRPEAPMLLWAALGLYLFVRGYPARRSALLALSGAAFGLAMMSKLFGALPMAGVALFLGRDLVAARGASRRRDVVRAGLTMAIPFALVVLAIGGAFTALAPNFVAAVLGHHVRQGQGTPAMAVVGKTLALYRDYALAQPLYIALAAAGAILSLRGPADARGVFVWQLPTALAFFAFTRDLQARHLTYLVPALAALGGLATDRLWSTISQRIPRRPGLASLAVAAVLALALWPHIAKNALVASWRDDTTSEWVAYIQARTAPDDVVVSDYPGINFYAQRRTTRLAAGISEGAASSGQILGADLIAEIEASGAPIVLFNIAHGGHQFVNLRDHPALREYLLQHYYLSERRDYDARLIEVFSRQDYWPGAPLDANLGNTLRLTGVQWLTSEAASGEDLRLNLRWIALAPMDVDYGVTLRLMDAQGHAWGLGHKLLMDIQDKTLWIEALECADLRPTSEWPVGEATIATFELPVDPGTPPGEYEVVVRVHPQGAWDSLPVLGANGVPQGYDIAVGRARVLPAALPIDTTRMPVDERRNVDAAPGVTLLGYSPLPGQVRPGDAVPLLACWQAREAALPLYNIRLTLQGDDRVWGELNAALSRDDYPTPQWREGEAVCGRYELAVDAETPNGSYALTATLLDAGGRPVGASHTLGEITVTGRQRVYEVPAMQHPVGARLGGAVTLLGYDLAPGPLRAGATLDLTLYWRAEARVGAAYKVFTHLIDGADRVWGQQDNEPVEGAYPTTGWLPGEIVVDAYHLALDPSTPEGDYAVEVGMYDAATVVRLPASDAEGAPLPNDRILIPGLRVAP